MATKIAWTNETWNPVVGCTKVSAGCDNCYAERMAHRLSHMGQKKYRKVITDGRGLWNGDVFCDESALDKPLHWKTPRMIFVCSMSDLFHKSVNAEFLIRVLNVIDLCRQHTFQVLTKRPGQMLKVMNLYYQTGEMVPKKFRTMTPYSNVWLGVTIESPDYLYRAKLLSQIPAAVTFWSIEPMLESFDADILDALHLYKPNWVIVGGESGPKRRECKIEWMIDIVNQCKAADVPVFVKQIPMWQIQGSGGWLFETEKDALESDIRSHLEFNNKIAGKKNKLTPKLVLVKDINLFPKELRFQEYPR